MPSTNLTTHPMPARPTWATGAVTDEQPDSVIYETTLGKVPVTGVLSSGQRQMTVTLSRIDRATLSADAVTIERGEPLVLMGHELLNLDAVRQLAALLLEAAKMLEADQ